MRGEVQAAVQACRAEGRIPVLYVAFRPVRLVVVWTRRSPAKIRQTRPRAPVSPRRPDQTDPYSKTGILSYRDARRGPDRRSRGLTLRVCPRSPPSGRQQIVETCGPNRGLNSPHRGPRHSTITNRFRRHPLTIETQGDQGETPLGGIAGLGAVCGWCG